METLRAYLTPQAKKQKKCEDSDDDTMRQLFDDYEGEDAGDEPPAWAKAMRHSMIKEMRMMLSPVNITIKSLR